MIHLGSSSNAGQYYLYRQDAGKMMLLARVNEKLRSADLVPTRYVHYKAATVLRYPPISPCRQGATRRTCRW
jgi:hypothetical protein